MDNRKRILEMLSEGKINPDEAMELLKALETDNPVTTGIKKVKYLRVMVDSPRSYQGTGPGKVNIRVPVSLIRAGIKFTSVIPKDISGQVEEALARKGVNVNLKNIKEEDVEDLIEALREVEVDVDGGEGKVRIYAE